ncbi:MAG: hypothetical protein Q8P36_01845 [bacterium]|nr:hypothetical protein [bacterium]
MAPGNVEARARKKRRQGQLRMAILFAVGATAAIAVATIAPNAVLTLKRVKLDARLRYHTKTVLGRLTQDGEVEFVERDGKKYARLTEKGERKLELYKEKLRLAGKPRKRWDGNYRLVIFDIPEKRKRVRERIRHEMREVGFLRVQDSAWVYPYDCEAFIALLKAELHIGKDVLYAVIASIEHDVWIRKHFCLPLD